MPAQKKVSQKKRTFIFNNIDQLIDPSKRVSQKRSEPQKTFEVRFFYDIYPKF